MRPLGAGYSVRVRAQCIGGRVMPNFIRAGVMAVRERVALAGIAPVRSRARRKG
jgi:hypothetical protein